MSKDETKLMWSVSYGRIPSKPVKVIELGDGYIKVVGSCLIKQKQDQRHESYHETYKEAMIRFLTDAQRDVKEAQNNLANAKRRLSKAKSKWANFVAAGDL